MKVGSIDLDIMIDEVVTDQIVSNAVDPCLNRIENELKVTKLSVLLIGVGTLLWMLKVDRHTLK